MAAFVTIRAGEPTDPALDAAGVLDELFAALARALVVSGVEDTVLTQLAQRLLDPTSEVAETQVATGTAPSSGRDGCVEVKFEHGLAAGSVDADGRMDFLERHLLTSVAQDQILAIVRSAQPGSAGRSVDGQVLPARSGTEAKLKLGSGVAVDAEGNVRALRGGVVLFKPGEALDVVDRHVHQGAVDLRTGHLDMQGSLSVQGDVERLLQVRVSGDVEILGAVSGGSVRAGGSVKVSGSVRGGDDARIVAGADVTLKSCESGEVTAQGVLSVQEAVNSTLCGRTVIVTGRVRGGSAIAESAVKVKEAGSSAGITTLLQAGEPLELPDLEQVQRAVVMQKLRRMAERGGVRDAFGSRGDARGKGGKLGRVNAALSQDELAKLAERAERRTELQRSAYLELGTAHAGVELRIGAARLTLDQTVKNLRYFLSPETAQLSAERTTE